MKGWVAITAMLVAVPAGAQIAQPRVVDGLDLAVTPRKFIEEAVELRNAVCLFAGANEYRCTTLSPRYVLAVFTKDVAPESAKAYIERECGRVRDLETRKCRFNLRFVPTRYEFDKTDGYQDRTVLRPYFIHLTPLSQQKRR